MVSLTTWLALLAAAPLAWATDCDFKGGFAARRPDECEDGEVKCGKGATMRCCPKGFHCKGTVNGYCCPKDEDCLEDILNVPGCPDENWTLWSISEENFANDAFCCSREEFGVIINPGKGLACSPFDEDVGPSQTAAPAVRDPKSTCTSGSTTVTKGTDAPLKTETGEPGGGSGSEDDGPALEGGAIAGVVVGSVAGVAIIVAAAWWLLRRRAAKRRDGEAAPTPSELGGRQMHTPGELGDKMTDAPAELGGKQRHSPAELGGQVERPAGGADPDAVYELPDNTRRAE